MNSVSQSEIEKNRSGVDRNIYRALFATAGMFFMHGFFVAVLAGYFPILKRQLNATEAEFAVCLTALGLGTLLAVVFSTSMVRRYGSARTTFLAALIACGLLSLQAFLSDFYAVAAVLFLLGTAISISDIAMNVQASLIEQRTSSNYMTRIHGCWSVGGILGSLIAGAVIERLQPTTYVLAFAIFIVVAVAVATKNFMKDERRSATTSMALPILPLSLLSLGLIAMLAFMASGGIRDWAAIYLSKDLGSSLSFSVQIFAAFSAATAIGRFGGDAFRDRFGEKPLILFGGVVGFVALAIGLQSVHPWTMFAAVAVLGLAHSNLIPALISVAAKVDPGHEARNVSGIMALGYAGYIVGPPLIGVVASEFGLASGLWLICISSLMIAIVGLKVRRAS